MRLLHVEPLVQKSKGQKLQTRILLASAELVSCVGVNTDNLRTWTRKHNRLNNEDVDVAADRFIVDLVRVCDHVCARTALFSVAGLFPFLFLAELTFIVATTYAMRAVRIRKWNKLLARRQCEESIQTLLVTHKLVRTLLGRGSRLAKPVRRK